MRKAVSSEDVARHAGVSRTTVSFVLNGSENIDRIPAATRERVLRSAEALGYTPNQMARALITGRSNLINLLVLQVSPAYYSRMVEAFNAVLRQTGYELRIHETAGWEPEQWKRAANNRWPVDGIIVIEEEIHLPHLVEALRGRIPLVNVGPQYCDGVDHVGIDLYSASAHAVRHLRETGRSRIAYLGLSVLDYTSRPAAYRATMEELGLEPVRILMEPDYTKPERALARDAIARFLAAGATMDGLFCFNDEMAIGALKAARDFGLRVPQDLAIVGCDNIEETLYHDPMLSTLSYPADEIARLTWQVLKRRIDEPDIPLQSADLAASLIIRESSSPA